MTAEIKEYDDRSDPCLDLNLAEKSAKVATLLAGARNVWQGMGQGTELTITEEAKTYYEAVAILVKARNDLLRSDFNTPNVKVLLKWLGVNTSSAEAIGREKLLTVLGALEGPDCLDEIKRWGEKPCRLMTAGFTTASTFLTEYPNGLANPRKLCYVAPDGPRVQYGVNWNDVH